MRIPTEPRGSGRAAPAVPPGLAAPAGPTESTEALPAASASADPVPLVVDLDGTLLRTDLLVEALFDVARREPLELLRLPAWLAGGPARAKRQLALRAQLDLSLLPTTDDLLLQLQAARRAGRRLVLATGADATGAQAVADRLGLFDSVLASDGRLNLSGAAKRDRLVAEFGRGGFDYVGNSWRDLPVWAAARRAWLVRPSQALARAAAGVADVERVYLPPATDPPAWRSWWGALRVSHWLKNLLVLVPLLAAQQLYQPALLMAALLALLCFSLVASGVYLLNDLFDLPSDRRHPHKRGRALASGRVSTVQAMWLVPLLWCTAGLLALALPPPFLGALGLYAALMLAYSMRLRDYPIVDALALAAGYTLRIGAGALASGLAVSAWLLVCSTALFFGLALLKRYAELVTLRPGLGAQGRVRGYGVGDATLIAGLGVAADCIAVALLALLPVTEAPQAPRPTLWLLSTLLLFWTGHMWLMAHRGRIVDEPVAFACRDPLSRAFGLAAAAVLLLAAWAQPARAQAAAAPGPVAPQPGAPSTGADAFMALQVTRQVQRVAWPAPPSAAEDAVLTHLAPAVNAWLLLSLPARDGRAALTVHLENADPRGQRLSLDPAAPGTMLVAAAGATTRCTLWPGPALAQAVASRLPYAPLCDGRLYLRNAVAGRRTALEATTQFLRDHVWGGEQVIGFVKREFYRDAFAERAAAPASGPSAPASTPGAPPAARLRPGGGPPTLQAPGLGIGLSPPGPNLATGAWRRAAGFDAVWVSAAPPGALAEGLDAVESDALAYLVAFDLARFELGFALGTEHPRLGWSPRTLPAQRPEGLPGPDGFDSAAPLVRNGLLAPHQLPQVAATFTGGFKREHGAFRHGALAAVHHGSHYGFIEQGVVFSRLQPGLATLLVQADGTVDLRTWRAGDEARTGPLRHARQNGVPLVEPGPGGAPVPGALVSQWGAGNWSGSASEQLRTLRAGACLVLHEGRRFLVYGYFSSATPRGMARVFLAYGCRYALHLDMNALEHTYLALYTHPGGRVAVEHLVPGMAVLDQSLRGALLPRFLAAPDDRDFFYLTHKAGP